MVPHRQLGARRQGKGETMAVRGGDVIHVANDTVLIDRLQTAGPGSVNIRREQIYELGNYRSVASIPDIPDLSFSMESFDVTCEMEAFLLDLDVADTHVYDLSRAGIVNLKSAFKPGQAAANAYDTVESAAIPALRLEQMQYRFGVGNNSARQTATLKGDSLYYNPGSTYIQRADGTNAANQTIALTNPAYGVVEQGVERHTLAVTVGTQRLTYGTDYTETVGTLTDGAGTVTVKILAPVASTDKIAVVYASPTVEAFPQSVHALVSGVSGTTTAAASVGATTVTVSAGVSLAPGTAIIFDDAPGSATSEVAVVASQAGQVVTLKAPLTFAHASGSTLAVYAPTVKPAAVRGRDIDVFVGPAFAPGTSPALSRGIRRAGVQSADVDWRVSLQNDEELGNSHYVNIDFDVPQVSGNVSFRPATAQALLKLVQDLSGETSAVRSAQSGDSPLLDVQVAIKNPTNGRVLKRLHVPDARFSLPGYSGRVQQKLDLSAAFQSDQGILKVYDY
jgi:hypothetical protein